MFAYANALSGSFQFDDYKVIADYQGIHSWADWAAGLGHGIRSVLKASYTLDWTLDWGATGFHTTNLLIHLLACWLTYLLTQHFIAHHERLRGQTSLPIFVALMFALHPAHTEAVTYISGRSASLMSVFYLAGVLAYVRGQKQMLTAFCFALALLTKETAVTFPFALLLWEVSTLGKWRDAVVSAWSSWILLSIAALFFLFSASYQSQMLNSVHFNTLGGNVATQLSGAVWLLQQWFAPLWLNIDPDLPVYLQTLDAPDSLLIVSMMLFTAWHFRYSRPWITLAVAWALLQFVPLYLLLPRLDVANERQLYLAAWPLCMALLIELVLVFRSSHTRLFIIALLLICGLLTVQRNQDYRNEIALWEDTALKSPYKSRVHNNLGYAYLQAGREADAEREFIAALQIDPQLPEAQRNLRELENKKAGAMHRP